MNSPTLRRITPAAFEAESRLKRPVDPVTEAEAAAIVEDVRRAGEPALRRQAQRLGDLPTASAPLVIPRPALLKALAQIPRQDRAVLERTAARIRDFAESQRACLAPLDIPVEGGRAGHRWIPAASAGCYAPGGRYPLPSSVLMTAIPARVAGVQSVWVASPRPAPITLAAAAIAGADGVIAVGGAQAIAALAFGTLCQPSDMIVGPGNRWVTAAKKYLFAEVGIDGLAGPSELVVIADARANPALIAADLLAQAEHDPDAIPILITPSEVLASAVDVAIVSQLSNLPTAATAGQAMTANGRAIITSDLVEAAEISNRIAPEHLELCTDNPHDLAQKVEAYGGLFIGAQSAEVFGDYGAGPNHVLPTGGTARFQAGLSVMTFLRPSTWLELDDPKPLAKDAAHLARLEGLEAHARATGR